MYVLLFLGGLIVFALVTRYIKKYYPQKRRFLAASKGLGLFLLLSVIFGIVYGVFFVMPQLG